MASGKRASMREGPLAQLFRKTDEEEAGAEAPRAEAEPKAGRPLPEDGPAPQAMRQVPEPRPERRAEERAERRRQRESGEEPQRVSRYEGVPTPEERLRSVFSSDIPENIM